MKTNTHRPAAGASSNENGGRTAARPPMDTHMKTSTVAHLGQANTFIREGVCTFTPAQANMVLRDFGYEKNRDVTRAPDHVATLSELMRRGLWLPKDQIAFADYNGRLILINGHHRMAAQAASGVNVTWSVAIHPCRSEQDVAALYYRFDTNVRQRSDNNIIAGAGFSAGTGLGNAMAAALYKAAPIIASGLCVANGKKNTGGTATFVRRIVDDRIAIARDYIEEAKQYELALANAHPKLRQKLMTAAMVALALVTLRAHASRAYDFWAELAENDGLGRTDPRGALATVLLETRGNSGPMGLRLYLAAKAWNAYIEGREVQVLRSGQRINVAGTSFWVTP